MQRGPEPPLIHPKRSKHEVSAAVSCPARSAVHMRRPSRRSVQCVLVLRASPVGHWHQDARFAPAACRPPAQSGVALPHSRQLPGRPRAIGWAQAAESGLATGSGVVQPREPGEPSQGNRHEGISGGPRPSVGVTAHAGKQTGQRACGRGSMSWCQAAHREKEVAMRVLSPGRSVCR